MPRFLTCCVCALAVSFQGTALERESIKSILELNSNPTTEHIQHDEHPAWKISLGAGDNSKRTFNPPDSQTWDWSGYVGLRVKFYNPNPVAVPVELRAESPTEQGTKSRSVLGNIPPECHYELTLFFTKDFAEQCAKKFWGMRGLPFRNLDAKGDELELSHITNWQLYLPKAESDVALYLEEAQLIGGGGIEPEALVPMPFVDRFGQFMHEDWPGKIHSEIELKQAHDAEEKALMAAPELAGRDAFGGWSAGPQLTATGWFRTEKVADKWWLVTPSGHLFFSNGVDCVGLAERTFVEGRESWFEWLPTPELPPFDAFYGYANQVHSMAETIGGKGKTFSFYRANLYRKYGENWEPKWQEKSYARLRAWGFNTLGNWSDWKTLKKSPIPFVVSGAISGVPEIEGATGYWGKMGDVYAPEFAPQAEKTVKGLLQEFGKNPLCIGYFIDNELAWEGVSMGILKSSNTQPARQAFIAFLQRRYGNLDAFNMAWEMNCASWEEVGEPQKRSKAMTQDQDDFLYHFALRYFQIIQGEFKAQGSNQLYLGCRFASTPAPAVKASTEVADISSFNRYENKLDCIYWQEHFPWDAPMIIGEFHFGALDRGMFHPGLVPTTSQQDRGEHYLNFVRSVADCPNFVGCHWFQYVDEPVTGRYFDGENYNIGFVSVSDTPYKELVDAARQVNTELYMRRSQK